MANTEERNPFEEQPDVLDEMYGAVGLEGDARRQVVQTIPLEDIRVDIRQPRRAIPASVRLHWDGSPREIRHLLDQWYVVACRAAGIGDLNILHLVQGIGDGIETEGKPAVFSAYVELLRLAASIRARGLDHPIRLVKQGTTWLIESGERRYLAHWLLRSYDPEGDWRQIPALESDGKGFVWKQAQENTQRRALNAIGMARQFALLLMDALDDQDGVTFDEYEALVEPGYCDRRFYAQVANGNIHRIPRGMGEQFEGAMGISAQQMRRYRSLLRPTEDESVNDLLWMRADVEDWFEGQVRKIVSDLSLVQLQEELSRDGWNLQTLYEAAERYTVPRGTVYDENGADSGDSGVISVSSGADETGWIFEVGEAIQKRSTEEYGEVIEVEGDQLLVEIEGCEAEWDDAVNYLSLGVSWAEFLADEQAEGVTFEDPEEFDEDAYMREALEDEDATRSEWHFSVGDHVILRGEGEAIIHELKEPHSAVIEMVDGQMREVVLSDLTKNRWKDLPRRPEKGDSRGSRQVLILSGTIWSIGGPAIVLNAESVKTLNEIQAITLQQAHELGAEGILNEILDGYREQIARGLDEWFNSQFLPDLQQIAEVGNEA